MAARKIKSSDWIWTIGHVDGDMLDADRADFNEMPETVLEWGRADSEKNALRWAMLPDFAAARAEGPVALWYKHVRVKTNGKRPPKLA